MRWLSLSSAKYTLLTAVQLDEVFGFCVNRLMGLSKFVWAGQQKETASLCWPSGRSYQTAGQGSSV